MMKKNEDDKSDDNNNANMKNNIITMILVRARSQRIPISLKYEFAYDICNDDDDLGGDIVIFRLSSLTSLEYDDDVNRDNSFLSCNKSDKSNHTSGGFADIGASPVDDHMMVLKMMMNNIALNIIVLMINFKLEIIMINWKTISQRTT